MNARPNYDRAYAEAAGALVQHAEKRPLFRPLPPPAEFPLHALGPLKAAAEAIHHRTQAPLALCAQSVLAAATLAVQAHCDVELPGGGRKPLTGLFASVADSGERKSSVDRLALAPVYRLEEAWRADHDAALDRHRADLAAWKEAAERIKKDRKADRGLIRDRLLALGSEPKPPASPMLLVADPTPEALILHLRDARPWGGVFTAEGGVLLGGAAFNDESRMRTGALFNTLWDGEPIRRTRVLTGGAYLPGRRCSAHVMMQPAVADRLFGDAMLDGIGMLARVLLVAPESTAGTRLFREASPAWAVALAEYEGRLSDLLARPPRMRDGTHDVLDPRALTLSTDARRGWIGFHDAAERNVAERGAWRSIRAFGAKAAEHAGRLAAILAAYADPDAREVSADHVECGIVLARHYAGELIRLAGAASVAPDLQAAAALLRWWQARPGPQCHLAAIYQFGPNAIRSAPTARAAVAVLEDAGWIKRLPPGSEIDGAPRREAWELLP